MGDLTRCAGCETYWDVKLSHCPSCSRALDGVVVSAATTPTTPLVEGPSVTTPAEPPVKPTSAGTPSVHLSTGRRRPSGSEETVPKASTPPPSSPGAPSPIRMSKRGEVRHHDDADATRPVTNPTPAPPLKKGGSGPLRPVTWGSPPTDPTAPKPPVRPPAGRGAALVFGLVAAFVVGFSAAFAGIAMRAGSDVGFGNVDGETLGVAAGVFQARFLPLFMVGALLCLLWPRWPAATAVSAVTVPGLVAALNPFIDTGDGVTRFGLKVLEPLLRQDVRWSEAAPWLGFAYAALAILAAVVLYNMLLKSAASTATAAPRKSQVGMMVAIAAFVAITARSCEANNSALGPSPRPAVATAAAPAADSP